MSPPADNDLTPLTNAEITHLETLLGSPAFKNQAMGLDEIQGFVCAVLSGPVAVKPERWLAAVLGNPEYEDAAQEEKLKSMLLRFHTEILADLEQGESLGLVLNLNDAANAATDGEYDYSAWCQAFLDGVEFSAVAWTDAGDESEVNELLFPISLLAGEIDPKALKQIKPRELKELFEECREDLPMQAIDIYKFFKKLRERPAATVKQPGSGDTKPTKSRLH